MASLTDKISDWTTQELAAFVRQIQNTNYDFPGGLNLSDLAVKNLTVEGDFNVEIATGAHIRELGEGARGKFGFLSSSDDHLLVAWDFKTNKWVTQPMLLGVQTAAKTTTSTSGVAVGSGFANGPLIWYRSLLDAGMVPQFRLSTFLSSDNVAGVTTGGLILETIPDGGSGGGGAVDPIFDLTNPNGSNGEFKFTTWLDISLSLTLRDFLLSGFYVKTGNAAHTAIMANSASYVRWVNA